MKNTCIQIFDWKVKLSDLMDFYRPNRKIVEEVAMIVDGDSKKLFLKIIYKDQKNVK